jgi:predicted nucleotidyltransferase
MGPGRWGSRGDIKLGVPVSYGDINNTALLVEIARKKGNYVPDLSFGTHFFQDLVEASIRYLPLYPDDEGIYFNERFLKKSPNILHQITPEFEYLSGVIRVIDIPSVTDGEVLKVLLNADLEEGLGLLSSEFREITIESEQEVSVSGSAGDSWRWRLRMVKQIAARLDAKRFGVKGFYVFGSTKNAIAGPGSDIDVLIHFKGNEGQKKDLEMWLEGWSLCLSEMNYLRTGYKTDGILDVHFVSDDEVEKKSGFAVKIDAVTDAAQELALKKSS